MIAIHNSTSGFHPHWVAYCKEKKIPYKLVNCYDNDIIKQLEDCKILFWHHHHNGVKDILVAKQILFALEHTGFKVFPDFKTGWHFDDKIGQKYLFEANKIPMIKTDVFFSKKDALKFIENARFPLVFKLRSGASASNVKLVFNSNEAIKIINKSFSKGFSLYSPWNSLKDRWEKFLSGKIGFIGVIKGAIRLFILPEYAKIKGREKNYIYFQEFIPLNDFDTRLIVIDEKVYGMKRNVRKGDFRASGSGVFDYDNIDKKILALALEIAKKLKLQAAAFDFIYMNNEPVLIEVSYGFGTLGSSKCPGYWDKELNFHKGEFNPFGWMIESVLKND